MQEPFVYIIIVNYQRWMDTLDCIGSVFRSGYKRYAVFIVDNQSGNDSPDQIEAHLPGKAEKKVKRCSGETFSQQVIPDCEAGAVYLISNESNTGFAAANNLVLKKLLKTDALVWLLNPDMTVHEDCLLQLVQFYRQQPAPVVTGALVYSHGANPELLFYGGGKVNPLMATITPLRHNKADIPDYISGSCLFTHTSVFRETGLLPEDYFLYWEETDWCHQAREKGFALTVCPEAVCYDKISTVIGRGFLADYYYTRNGLYFVKKYAPAKTVFVMFFVLLRFGKRLFSGQTHRARGVAKGLRDFIKRKTHALQ